MQEHATSERRLANFLGALGLAVGDMVMDVAQEEGEGPSASAAIIRIGKFPGQSIDFLSRALPLSHSATVRIVDRLAELGLVLRERESEPDDERDRRTVALYLTDEGETRYKAFLEQRYEKLLPLLSSLSPRQRTQFLAIAEKLLATLSTPDGAGRICRMCDAAACEADGCPVGHYPPELTPNVIPVQ
ncbi:MAG: MarR family transcriptional regulator [Dehalococcoidia bacterium]